MGYTSINTLFIAPFVPLAVINKSD